MDLNPKENVVLHDSYDQQAYESIRHLKPGPEAIASGYPLAITEPFLSDIFYSMYRQVPTLRDSSQLSLAGSVFRSMMEEMMSTNGWHTVRASGTIGDPIFSGIATARVGKVMLDSIDKHVMERIQQLQKAEEKAKDIFQEAEALEDMAQARQSEDLFEQAKRAKEMANEAQKHAEELSALLEQQAEQIEDISRQAARKGLAQAEEEVLTTQNALKALTGAYQGGIERTATDLTLEQKLSIAEAVNKNQKLKTIMELTGRFTRIALATQKTRIVHPPDEVVGIEIGSKIEHALPGELSLLNDPLLENVFFKKMVEGQLLQLDLKGSEKQGRGPIIVALDSTGSMRSSLGKNYTKEEWSKGVVMAMLAIARLQKRDFSVIHFGYGKKLLKVYDFPKGQGHPQDILNNLEHFYAARGTEYGPWMDVAMQKMEESSFQKADIIIVSDGEVTISAQLEAEWNHRLAAKEAKAIGVLLGAPEYAQVLGRVTKALVTIDNLTAEDKALKMMFEV